MVHSRDIVAAETRIPKNNSKAFLFIFIRWNINFVNSVSIPKTKHVYLIFMFNYLNIPFRIHCIKILLHLDKQNIHLSKN